MDLLTFAYFDAMYTLSIHPSLSGFYLLGESMHYALSGLPYPTTE
jgi:hypothetical protein